MLPNMFFSSLKSRIIHGRLTDTLSVCILVQAIHGCPRPALVHSYYLVSHSPKEVGRVKHPGLDDRELTQETTFAERRVIAEAELDQYWSHCMRDQPVLGRIVRQFDMGPTVRKVAD